MSDQVRDEILEEFYGRLNGVGAANGLRRLGEATAADGWPTHGVYFFFEAGELRREASSPRVVRVGTHALTATSRTTLWTRLRAHRGSLGGRNPGGGNHRGSVFRLHVGTALNARGEYERRVLTWGQGSSAPRDIREGESALERDVSKVIGAMYVVVVDVPDRHDRACLEQFSIALLSTAAGQQGDLPSTEWLGHEADRPAIRESGLWNVNHVHDAPTELRALSLIR